MRNPLEAACSHVSRQWQGAADDIGQRWEALASNSGQLIRKLVDIPVQAVQRHAQHLQRQPLLPAFASLSLGSSAATQRRKPQPIAEVAYNPEDIKARLSGVPVFAVTNKNNEFVLVSGEGDSEDRQLGLIFFAEADAHALIEKIREQNPKLAKQSTVLAVTMDDVYSFAIAPRDASNASGVVFRFMPDMRQVDAALDLYRNSGVDVVGFTGVPVFQAEGLTVKTEKSRYTPLFLDKADLDAAVSNAYKQRVGVESVDNQAKADRATSELKEAEELLDSAKDRKAKKAATAAVEIAQERLARYTTRLAELAAAPKTPKIEVGALEEIIVQMEHDTKQEWSDVMIVPAGALMGNAVQKIVKVVN